mmetsp:Transcript_6305/g.13613  ORF Transcript_6305/g.13613 Transcript_6305/m.13613 type:complete len:132 (+) Transcript_6305:721-1116(+)
MPTWHLSKCCRIVSRSGAFDLPRLRRGPCGEFRLATPSSWSCVRIAFLVPLKIHKQAQKPKIVHAELGHSGERTRFSATSKDPKCPDNPLFWRHFSISCVIPRRMGTGRLQKVENWLTSLMRREGSCHDGE